MVFVWICKNAAWKSPVKWTYANPHLIQVLSEHVVFVCAVAQLLVVPMDVLKKLDRHCSFQQKSGALSQKSLISYVLDIDFLYIGTKSTPIQSNENWV